MIFGQNKIVACASAKGKGGIEAKKQITSAELVGTIVELLQAGKIIDRTYGERLGGKPYLTVLQSILKERAAMNNAIPPQNVVQGVCSCGGTSRVCMAISGRSPETGGVARGRPVLS